MTSAELEQYPGSYVGLMKIVKPRKGQKIGIAYADYHHLAIIDDTVFLFIWDTRDIIDSSPLSILQNFDAVQLSDIGTQLRITQRTSDRAKTAAMSLIDKYNLPIITDSKPTLANLKSDASDALKEVDTDVFDIDTDASIMFVDKDVALPDNMYMYSECNTFNPCKRKFMDMHSYQGRAKYLAIVARCQVLKMIKTLNAL